MRLTGVGKPFQKKEQKMNQGQWEQQKNKDESSNTNQETNQKKGKRCYKQGTGQIKVPWKEIH